MLIFKTGIKYMIRLYTELNKNNEHLSLSEHGTQIIAANF